MTKLNEDLEAFISSYGIEAAEKYIQQQLKFLEQDPYDIVDADMDGFHAYIVINIAQEYYGHDWSDWFEEWVNDDYLSAIQDNGGGAGVKKLKQIALQDQKQLTDYVCEKVLL